MKNDENKKKTEQSGKPFLSAPVISREGKIKRVAVEEPGKKKKSLVKKNEKRALRGASGAEEKRGEVIISDGEFMQKDEKKAKNKRGVHTVNSKIKSPFPVVTVLACVICTVLFMSLIFNLVRINEYTKDVSDMRSEVTELTKQKNELSAALDEKNNVENLKKYLSEHAESMGIVEEGRMNPPVAVTPEKSEKIEDYNATEESDAVITTVLNALAKNFFDVIDAFTGNS